MALQNTVPVQKSAAPAAANVEPAARSVALVAPASAASLPASSPTEGLDLSRPLSEQAVPAIRLRATSFPVIVSPEAIKKAYPGVTDARARELANGPLNGIRVWPPAISPNASALCQMPNGVLTRRGADGQVWVYTPTKPPHVFTAPKDYAYADPKDGGAAMVFTLKNGQIVTQQGTPLAAPTAAKPEQLKPNVPPPPAHPGKIGPGAYFDGTRARFSVDGQPFSVDLPRPAGLPADYAPRIKSVRVLPDSGRLVGVTVEYTKKGEKPFPASYTYTPNGFVTSAKREVSTSPPPTEPVGYACHGATILERAGMKAPFLVTVPAYTRVVDGKPVVVASETKDFELKENAESFARHHEAMRHREAEKVNALDPYLGPSVGP